jgi:pSer/pThr/pTyr-binding forkhead associated (FHA) protein
MAPSIGRLEVVAGNAIGMSILLEDELLIGRHADGAGRLAGDEEISRAHARISLDRSGFCAIEDLGSTNGTFVNGLSISSPHPLSVGDAIELGATRLVVRELQIPATGRPLEAVRPLPGAAGASTAPTSASQVTPASRSSEGHDHDMGSGRVSLRLQIDFGAREATVALGNGSPPLKLAFDRDPGRQVSS